MAALKTAEQLPIMEYIRRPHATIAEKLSCRPIYELCLGVERRLGMSQRMRWWDKDVVNEPEMYTENICN